ncbi:PREDICTED: uncharacterized protein LOC107191979 [Dufourea novaeangliae]|uniref:Uncharacterized protein n=1 Tax=Dufourea novaeangliae TaxID=178035 RepID=A0A154PPL1_DUFNO|nr:PREDICTED: uncharacterized protein LOC107191979 [Dufourea novaeangliae]KZC13821.1 hypothetical protein WN55_05725 [Dufourea novaeangliae]
MSQEVVESFYDDEEETEDYAESTDLPEEESSETEGGEILKHGETGMAILLRAIKRFRNKHRKQIDTAADETKMNETSMDDLLNDATMHFNESRTAQREEKDEAGSNVSSKISINGEMILETTLLDVTTDRVRNSPKTPDTNHMVNTERPD